MHPQHEWRDLSEKGKLLGKSSMRRSSLICYLHQHDETMQCRVLSCLPKMRTMHAGNLLHPHAEEA
jgi:hypothetical protein